ncbi:hypothetical protein [Streptomyces sp. NPDC048603]|uniref:hypothetical protein n=1 Tax=Streptomyces sp. NPDC048603 TaxID=3365577 RepID=UPI0037124210
MGFRDAVTTAGIGKAATKRMEGGHKIFAYRIQVPETPNDDMAAVADAIESVEALGWRLDRMEPDAFVGKSAFTTNRSWMLVFRNAL